MLNTQIYKPTSADIWQGRIDKEDADAGLRFHQKIKLKDQHHSKTDQADLVLLGFACDEGVKRNKGRIGAKHAPDMIRKALANTAWHHDSPTQKTTIVDAGNVYCHDDNLPVSQKELADHVEIALNNQSKVIVLGGGHEVTWGTFQGLSQHFQSAQIKQPKIGIINFDAHFDLRKYSEDDQQTPTSSGTPFNQIAQHCKALNWPFQYACLGVSRASNTQALFSLAESLNVYYREDHELASYLLKQRIDELTTFIKEVDYLYLTIDIDVFSASTAPGVSAPAARGISLESVEALLIPILKAKNNAGHPKLLIADIAEYNPHFDIDNQTARLAARLIWEISRKMLTA